MGASMAAIMTPAAQAQTGDEDRYLILGARAEYEPVFRGSSEYEVDPSLYVNARWGRFFAGQRGVGLDLYQGDGDAELTFGAAITLGEPRVEEDDIRLLGLGQVDRSIEATLFAEADLGLAEVAVIVGQDVGNGHEGLYVDLEAGRDFELGDRWEMEIGAATRWADATYVQTLYGVTAQQAARTAYQIFTPDSGFHTAALSAGLTYQLSDRWFVSTEAEVSVLLGDAKDSPFVSDTTSTGLSLGLARRF
jgi:outer membrane protein